MNKVARPIGVSSKKNIAMRFPYVILTAAYCAAIYWISSRPEPPLSSDLFPNIDKIAHAVLYGGLACVVSLGLRRSDNLVTPATQFAVPLFFASFYGLTDEIHQIFVPSRSFDIFDLLADTAGALAVQLILCGYIWKLPACARGSKL